MWQDIDKDTGKPEIITYFNESKGEVKTLDQLVRRYSCNRKANMWPIALFYKIFDIATYNAFILYSHRHPELRLIHKKQSRRKLMKLLTKESLPPKNNGIEEFSHKRPKEPNN